VYVRYAHKAEKHVIDLGVARDRTLIAKEITAVVILDPGVGNFTLHFIFFDGTEFELNQDEVVEGDAFMWDVQELRITNSTQPGLILKLLTGMQVEK